MASRKRSPLVKVLAVLVVLLLVAVVVDRAAAWLVEEQTEAAVESGGSQVRDPEIRIHGFPFLPQLASGRIDHVTGHLASGTFADQLVADVSFDAHGVVPRDPYPAREVRADGLLGLGSVADAISEQAGTEVTVERATLGTGDDAQEALALTMPVLGVELTATLTLAVLDDATLGADVQRVSLGAGTLDLDDLPGTMGDQLTGLKVPLDLPDGVKLTDASVEPGGVRVHLTAHDVALAEITSGTGAGTGTDPGAP